MELISKFIFESDSRLNDHPILMMMTTLAVNQKQNKFQFWKTVHMRAAVKETSESDLSDLEHQQNNDGSLQDSDENISGPIISNEDDLDLIETHLYKSKNGKEVLAENTLCGDMFSPVIMSNKLLVQLIVECIQQHDQLLGNNKDDAQNKILMKKLTRLRGKENRVAALCAK